MFSLNTPFDARISHQLLFSTAIATNFFALGGSGFGIGKWNMFRKDTKSLLNFPKKLSYMVSCMAGMVRYFDS